MTSSTIRTHAAPLITQAICMFRTLGAGKPRLGAGGDPPAAHTAATQDNGVIADIIVTAQRRVPNGVTLGAKF